MRFSVQFCGFREKFLAQKTRKFTEEMTNFTSEVD